MTNKNLSDWIRNYHDPIEKQPTPIPVNHLDQPLNFEDEEYETPISLSGYRTVHG